MAKNSMDQREAAFKSSEFLADILARYLILDKHCRNKELASSDGLDNAIVQVYKAILEYTAEVKKRQKASLLISSTVIRDIAEDHSNGLSFWYFQFSRNETQSVKNMTRSISRQLAPEELPRSLVSLWEEHGRQGREPDQEEFSAVLNGVINSHKVDRLFIIFDALDECPDNEIQKRDLLFQVLKGLIGEHGKNLHLLATSRFEENIRCHLEEGFKIDLED
ncbi:hypothetical protein APSETT444_006825 [Aspergillus pseudonomiae]